MGLNSYVFDLLATHTNWRQLKFGSVLFAGYPDFLVDSPTLIKHLGYSSFSKHPLSDLWKSGHGEPQLDYCRNPETVFATMNYNGFHVLDSSPNEGADLIVNLNEPQNILSDLLGRHDLVVDHGTIEHVFNIAQAAKTLVEAVAPDGFIVFHLPLNIYNHGFYNINPCFYHRFLSPDNGFKIVHHSAWDWLSKRSMLLPADREFNLSGISRMLYTVIAQRVAEVEITFPQQAQYS